MSIRTNLVSVALVLALAAPVAAKEKLNDFDVDCDKAPNTSIQDALEKGVSALCAGDAPAPYVISAPLTLEICFTHTRFADRAALMPATERSGGKSVVFQAPDMTVLCRAFRTMVAAARD